MGNPFDTLVSKTKVSEETKQSIGNPFDSIQGGVGFREAPEPDAGIIGSFSQGIGRGLVEPFTVLGAEWHPDPTIDTKIEKTSEFLGSMVGLGISFYPFAAGTGLLLKGVGLAGPLAEAASFANAEGRTITPLYDFVKNVVAGSAQFGGMSHNTDELKTNLATGALFGGAIEGLFLAKALRSRAGLAAAKGLVDIGQVAKEASLLPSEGKTAERMTQELHGLFGSEDVDLNKVLANLADNQTNSIKIPQLKNVDDLVAYVKERMPNAQVLTRKNQGMWDMFIHNPVDPAEGLTSKQITQWQNGGVFEGLEGIFNNKSYEHTGVPVSEGRVQLRDPSNPNIVFAPKVTEVHVPLDPQIYGASKNKLESIRQALSDIHTKLGFIVPAQKEGLARKGFLDTSKFEFVSSMKEFMEKYKSEIGSINAQTPQEAISIFAKNRGIQGIVESDSGIITNVHVFDQGSVNWLKEPPQPLREGIRTKTPLAPNQVERRMGLRNTQQRQEYMAGLEKRIGEETDPRIKDIFIKQSQRVRDELETSSPQVADEVAATTTSFGHDLDQAILSTDIESGKTLVHSIIPSWKNSIGVALRLQGLPEKELLNYVDLSVKSEYNKLADLVMDPEFKTIKKASESQYLDGCL